MNSEDTDRDLLHNEGIAKELSTNFPALKQVVAMGVQTNTIIPSLSASLEDLDIPSMRSCRPNSMKAHVRFEVGASGAARNRASSLRMEAGIAGQTLWDAAVVERYELYFHGRKSRGPID